MKWIVLSCLWLVYLTIMASWWLYKKNQDEQDEQDEIANLQRALKDSEFKTNVKKAKKAVGMEVNEPTELSGVTSELHTEDVEEAIGFSTNKGIA